MVMVRTWVLGARLPMNHASSVVPLAAFVGVSSALPT
jgi:hypothetical protein